MVETRKTKIPDPKHGSQRVKETRCPYCGSDRLETKDATEDGLLRTKYTHPVPIAAISLLIGYVVWWWIFFKLNGNPKEENILLSKLEMIPALTDIIRSLKAAPKRYALVGAVFTFIIIRKLITKNMQLFYDDGASKLRDVVRKGTHAVRYTCSDCKQQFEITYSSEEWMNHLWRERERKSDMDTAGQDYLPGWAAGLDVLGDLTTIYGSATAIMMFLLELLGNAFYTIWSFISNLSGNGCK